MSKSDLELNTPTPRSTADRRLPADASERRGTLPAGDETLGAVARTAAPSGYWSWDLTTGEIWYSAEFYRVHGLTTGALGGRLEDYLECVHPEDRQRIEESAWAAASGETSVAEYRFVHPESGLRHLVGSSALVRDAAGQPQRLVGMVQDLTEITRARRSLADSFTRLSAYFDETPTPAYLWRLEGDEVYLRRLNRAAMERWGEHATVLLGSPASEISADMPEALADIWQCLRSQEVVRREAFRDSPRLGRRRLVVTYVPLAPDTIVAHAEDISELLEMSRREEQATAQLAEYFQRVPTPAYLWRNRDGHIVLEGANLAAQKATAGAVTDLVGMSADEMYAGRPDIMEDLRRALAGETFTREMSYQMRSGGGPLDLVVTYVHIPPDVVVVHTRDVTQRRLMEAALRESHEAARGVLDACTQPIVLCDRQGKVLELNEAAIRSLGDTRGRILGLSMYDFFPADVVEGRRQAIEEVVRTGRPTVVEDAHDDQHHRARLYPLSDGSGVVDRVVVYAENVTEERRAHEALLRSRERLEEAQRIGHLGHWDLDAVEGKLTCSDELFRIFGLETTEEASLDEFVARVHPDDRERMRATVRGALESGERYHIEYRIQQPDGTVRFVLEQGEVKDHADGAGMLTGTVLDITDLKQAEQSIRDRETEMSTIIERNPDGICLIVGGEIRIANRAMTTMLGCPRESIEGCRLHDLMIEKDRHRAVARGRVLLDGGQAEPHEYTLQRLDGDLVPVEIYGTAFEFRGEPALICTLRDVAKRKQAERDLAESRDTLRALTQHLESVREQERIQVARDLHDELGSILTALKIDLGELESLEASAGEAELIGEMSKLLDQAFEVSRRVTTRLRPGILDDLGLAAAADWLGRDLERRSGVRCRVTLPAREPELPEPVATAMFRILQEAVTNVVRHAEADSVEIVLEADERDVSLTISDDGRGFDPGDTDVGRLGLVGMHERVRPFAGTLQVESAPGAGTMVRVVLPINGDSATA